MSISLPPRPPGLDDVRPLDPEALIEEARRRARRRRRRNVAGVLAALLGALWYSLVGGGGPENGAAFLSNPARVGAAPLQSALPQELSVDDNASVVLVGRDGTRQVLAPGAVRRAPNRGWRIRMYGGIEWSPDGTRLLAVRQQSPERPGIALVVLDASGSVASTIAVKAWHARWSPDGSRIAFLRVERGFGRSLFVASSDGPAVTRVASHLRMGDPPFSWSPRGSELVYASDDNANLYVADATGRRAPRRLATAPDGNLRASPLWSPDGSLIAFTTGGHVYVVQADGTQARGVAGGYGMAWSPDGKALAVVGPAGGTWGDVSVVRADGTRLHRVARCACTLRGPGFSQSVAWSSDGSRIAYVSGAGTTVSTVRPDGTGTTVVATFAGHWRAGLPLWRPDHGGS